MAENLTQKCLDTSIVSSMILTFVLSHFLFCTNLFKRLLFRALVERYILVWTGKRSVCYYIFFRVSGNLDFYICLVLY